MAIEEKKDDELEGTDEGVDTPEDEVRDEPETAAAAAKTAEVEAFEGDPDDEALVGTPVEDEPFEEPSAEEAAIAASIASGATAEPRSAPTRRRKKTGRKKRTPATTAGQRLAAAKAAKAARKAAMRGKDAEIVEDKATEQAEAASRWFERNRSKLLMAVAAVALIAVGVFAVSRFARAGDAGAAGALWEAMEVANARVVTEEDAEASEADADDDEQTFPSNVARAEAAITAFEGGHQRTRRNPGRRLRPRGHRQRPAGTLGKPAEARQAYEAALAESDDGEVALRSLEGLAFSFEDEENWSEAKARFEEMGDVERPRRSDPGRLPPRSRGPGRERAGARQGAAPGGPRGARRRGRPGDGVRSRPGRDAPCARSIPRWCSLRRPRSAVSAVSAVPWAAAKG